MFVRVLNTPLLFWSIVFADAQISITQFYFYHLIELINWAERFKDFIRNAVLNWILVLLTHLIKSKNFRIWSIRLKFQSKNWRTNGYYWNYRRVTDECRRLQTSQRRLQTSHRWLQTSHKQVINNCRRVADNYIRITPKIFLNTFIKHSFQKRYGFSNTLMKKWFLLKEGKSKM